MNEEMKKKFFELFTIDDLSEMQYALVCRFGSGYELSRKLEKFIEEIPEQKNCPICGNKLNNHDVNQLEECCFIKLKNEMGEDYNG